MGRLAEAGLTKAGLTEARLTETCLSKARLTETGLTEAGLTETRLAKTWLALAGGGLRNARLARYPGHAGDSAHDERIAAVVVHEFPFVVLFPLLKDLDTSSL